MVLFVAKTVPENVAIQQQLYMLYSNVCRRGWAGASINTLERMEVLFSM